jgi:hypothetical protein
MVSRREVAVTMCEDPAVKEVKMKRAGSVEYVVMIACWRGRTRKISKRQDEEIKKKRVQR